MSEDLNLKTEDSQTSHHHKHHRSHHHHHSSHHHHKNEHRSSSSHHSHSHRSRKKGISKIFRKIKSFFNHISQKLTIDRSSYVNKLKKVAHSSKSNNRKKYTTISKRVLFSAILLSILCYTGFVILSGEEDANIKNAGYTPSENSILKIQVMELEQQNAALEKELNRYKELYGELEESN